MGEVKANKETLANLKSESGKLFNDADLTLGYLTDFKKAVNSFTSDAEKNFLDNWKTETKNVHPAPTYPTNSDYGSWTGDEEKHSWQWNNDKVESEAKTNLQAACKQLNDYVDSMDSWDGASKAKALDGKIQDINTAIEKFEEQEPDLEKALTDIGVENAADKFETRNIELEDQKYEDVKVYTVEVDIDGKKVKVPVGEAVNAYYAYQGAASHRAVDMASVGKSEKELQEYLDQAAKNYQKMLPTHIFGVASKKDILGLYNDLAGKNGWKTATDASDIAHILADPSGYHDYINDKTNGYTDSDGSRAAWMGVLGLGLGGAVGVKDASPEPEQPEDTDEDEEQEEQEEKPWSGEPGPDERSNDGSNNGGGGKFKTPDTEVDKGKSDKGEKGDDKTPDLTDLTKDKLPSPLTEIKKDYDALAREKFDEQFKTEEEYAEYVMKVNEEFESLTPEQLSEKLKEYGYDESEIQYLLQPENKDVAATAYASGKLNADLTTRANELAKADNVKDFDTKYDDPIDRQNDNESDTSSYAYLRDGDLNANVSPVNYNKDVKAAKETWTKSQETYTTAATKANTAIEKANSQAAELEKLQKQYGKDTSKWKEAEIKKYNETVEKYNKAVTEAISANKEATTAKASMDKAQEAYTKQYNDYQDKIKKEARDAYAQGRQNNNNNGNPSDSSDAGNVTDTTPTGEIDPVTINSDGSISI